MSQYSQVRSSHPLPLDGICASALASVTFWITACEETECACLDWTWSWWSANRMWASWSTLFLEKRGGIAFLVVSAPILPHTQPGLIKRGAFRVFSLPPLSPLRGLCVFKNRMNRQAKTNKNNTNGWAPLSRHYIPLTPGKSSSTFPVDHKTP